RVRDGAAHDSERRLKNRSLPMSLLPSTFFSLVLAVASSVAASAASAQVGRSNFSAQAPARQWGPWVTVATYSAPMVYFIDAKPTRSDLGFNPVSGRVRFVDAAGAMQERVF